MELYCLPLIFFFFKGTTECCVGNKTTKIPASFQNAL